MCGCSISWEPNIIHGYPYNSWTLKICLNVWVHWHVWVSEICGLMWVYLGAWGRPYFVCRYGRADNARLAPIVAWNYERPWGTCGHIFESDLWVLMSSGGGCAKWTRPLWGAHAHVMWTRPFLRLLAHETFRAPASPRALSFSKISLKNVWKSVHYNPIFAASEIDIGRCSRVRHKFFEMIDMRQALYEPYGIRREHKIALGEWWKFMSDILSTRRVTGSKLHIMMTRLMLPT